MLTYGSGESGLAILGLSATAGDAHSGKPLHRIPMVWKAIDRDTLPKVLTGTLFGHTEPVSLQQLMERGEVFLSECQAKGIKTIIPIGSQALRAVSPVHGKSIKLIGSTITTGQVPFIIPVDTHWSGFRAFRSFDWVRGMSRFIRRGLKLAEGKGKLYQFPRIVTGEGPETIAALEQLLDEKLPVGNDIETTGKDFRNDAITAMGLANANVAVSVPWAAYTSRLYGAQVGLRCVRTRELVQSILSHKEITKIFHNGLFDLSVLGQKGIGVAGQIEDTYLAHKIVYPDLFHNLQFCLSHEHAVIPWKTLFDMSRKARGEGSDWADTSPAPLMTYNAQDAAAEIPLWCRLSEKLTAMHRGWENYRTLMELGELAADMQYHGVRIDMAARNELMRDSLNLIYGIEKEWEDLGHGVPITGEGSQKGITRVFFSDLKAPVIARSAKTGRELLGSAVLLEYAGMEDSLALAKTAWTLFKYRKLKKSYDAFLLPLTQERVHAKPNPAGTRGSRFSYSEPNLQQWSKEKTLISPFTKTEINLAPNLRHLVCPDIGFHLGEHDYNALEVRLMAYAANIDMWLAWLASGVDMHSEHVRLMFGRKVNKKDPLRQITKVLTFARFYNRKRSVAMVLKALKPAMPTLTEAFLTEVFRRFDEAVPQVMTWQEGVEKVVIKQGYVELPLSGMRQYHDKYSPDINAALSFGIQSTGGDIINRAALRIRKRLDAGAGERILINVHDALLWQAKPERVEAVAAIVTEEMEAPVDLWGHCGVVFPTEFKVGPNWRDLKGLAA